MSKKLKYTLRGLGVLAGLLALVYTAAYIYVIANKKKILSQVREQVAEKLNGNVQIGDIDIGFLSNFPGIAVELENISITDTSFKVHGHPFFKAKQLKASISVINLLRKVSPLSGITISQGQLYIYTDTSGYTNSYLFAPKEAKKTSDTTTGAGKVEIEKVKLEQVRIVLDDRLKNKLYDFDFASLNLKIRTNDPVIRFKVKTNAFVHDLAFNTEIGSYVKESKLEGDFDVEYNKTNKQLKFDDIGISLQNHPFRLTGAFNLTSTPSFALKVTTSNIGYDFARHLLTEKISSALSLVQIKEPIKQVKAEISGPLKGGDPLVNVQYKVKDNDIQSPFANFTNCSFTGSFTNEIVKGQPRKDPNSRLQFNDFKGNWEGIDMVSQKTTIDNLVTSVVTCDLKTDFQLSQLNSILQSNALDLVKGRGAIDITYSGPLKENNSENTIINGKMSFTDGLVNYVPHNIKLSDVSGDILFKNSDVFVTDFKSSVQGNKIIMNGTARNMMGLIRTNPGKVFIDWSVFSPSLNLTGFTSLLSQRSATTGRKAKSKLGNTGQNLDELINQGNFHLDVKANEFIYKRFTATALKASLDLLNQNWRLNNISLRHSGGSMNINGYLNEKNSRYYEARVKVQMQNVDVRKVFYSFDDFGQSGIQADNLRGKLTSSADITMDIERNMATQPTNLAGFIDFSLKNGALLHYEPLLKIQNVAFKNRNFSEVYFAELKDHFDIKDNAIKINRMEIQSTVLTLFIDGVYNLRGGSDLSIQVPLSNLKKRDEDYVPQNKGANSKGGASIYLRGRPGDDGIIQFKVDLFKKFRKKDKAEPRDSTKAAL